MTAKEYLKQAFTIDKRIKANLFHIQYLRDLQTSVGGTLVADKVQSSPEQDKIGRLCAEILDLEDGCRDDIKRLLDLQREIQALIDKVENQLYRMVLIERYLNMKRWMDIAVDNGYEERTIHRLHGRALQVIEIKLS